MSINKSDILSIKTINLIIEQTTIIIYKEINPQTNRKGVIRKVNRRKEIITGIKVM